MWSTWGIIRSERSMCTPGPCRNGHRYLAFVCGSFATFSFWPQVWDVGLTLALCPGVFSSGIRLDGSRVGGSPMGLFGVPSLVGSAGQVLPLGWERRLEKFSWAESAARRPLVHWCNIPEEFMRALVDNVIHPAGKVG
ncbi:hypothetical protein EVAR_89125_1 [Eumeta japonica]|uniref:Uncharacterized protein n=1 Tax=Eumeta variegata TaxID=151549 RepID=A0A4C1ZRW2_EUMVA|nr:hypothetical protein EVAR_89125_1 [Eumeta japonica]